MRFDTVRGDIFGRYAPLAELVNERFPDGPRGPEAFEYALELYLRAIPNLDVAVDGWKFLRVVQETPNTLRAVGISYVLPEGELPIEVELRLADGAIEYRILVGIRDPEWNSLTDSKRWKAVYAYATDAVEPGWNWDRPVLGTFEE